MISYSNRYSKIRERLNHNELVILDGGVGTELQKRGIEMDESWCGTASRNTEILKQVHLDYIKAGAQVITTNTYASSRLLLDAAGCGKDFEEINLKAISAAKAARDEVSDDILIAGSLSHRYPIAHGDMQSNATIQFEQSVLQEATDEMANFLSENGCDLILLEMMYHPDRIQTVFESAKKTNKPIWAGFSTRRTENGDILSLTDSVDVPFREIVKIIKDYELDGKGIIYDDDGKIYQKGTFKDGELIKGILYDENGNKDRSVGELPHQISVKVAFTPIHDFLVERNKDFN